MSTLTTRLLRLERRRPRPDICAEHATTSAPRSYRDGLAAFSPDPAERARYDAEQDALEAAPGCPRCGWKELPPFRVAVRPDWGQHGPE